MLEGDDSTAFALFAGLCKVLETSGVIVSDESKAAVEEYTSYIVERRWSHSSSRQSARSITDVVRHFLLDFDFQSRHRVLGVFTLCCLFVGMPISDYSAVTFDLSGSVLDSKTFQDDLFNHTLHVWGIHLKVSLVIRLCLLFGKLFPILVFSSSLRALTSGRTFVAQIVMPYQSVWVVLTPGPGRSSSLLTVTSGTR